MSQTKSSLIKQATKQKSKTTNTLLLILKQQIADLHQGVMEMDEDSLIKQIAKQKVIYNITRHQNALELVYSYIALCEYYISKELYEPAIKNLFQSLEVQETGDAYYQLGISFYFMKKATEATKMLQKCLNADWIQPSIEHQVTSQLEALNYLQLLLYKKIVTNPERKETLQEKLINLSYQKIKLTKKLDASKNNQRGENYYYSLAMADLAQIYSKLGEDLIALEKINTAITMFEGEVQSTSRWAEFYHLSAILNQRLGREYECREAIQKGVSYTDQKDTNLPLSESEKDLYYLMIKKNLGV